ncbi:MAG: FAD-binding oxidoreductase [Flavobacterium sp.]|nr:FAD-binding oxidoreductase [Flavobacterium sp.]
MVDYIIVGCGLAGIAFSETALQHGRSVVVFDDSSQTSSTIAGGLYNPVILKRFSGLQNAQAQLDKLVPFYRALEDRLLIKVLHPLPILRRFHSIEEQNDWFSASDKPILSDFLSPNLVTTRFNGIESPFAYGEVLQTGYVDTEKLLKSYTQYLRAIESYRDETFSYIDIIRNSDFFEYRGIKARNIVFAEGFGIHANPYFNYLPLEGTKGELLIIEAPDLQLDKIINSSIFILPLGNNRFKLGATYNWVDKTNNPSPAGLAELLQRAREVLNCEFKVIQHHAGIRPTLADRKPLLGRHPEIRGYYVFNGLGTRGVMLAPYMAEELFKNIEDGSAIAAENSITRYAASYPLTDRN